MDVASVYYLGITILLFLVFLAIVVYTYSGDRRARGEEAKYRMMDED